MAQVAWHIKVDLHLALRGVFGARDIEGIKVNMVSINILDNEHLRKEGTKVVFSLKENKNCKRYII